MRVLVLGVGDAFTRLHFGTSALVEGPGGHVLIDCPDLIHRAIHAAATASGWPIDARGIHDIILTHLHGDHCNGLESFAFLRRIQRQDDPDLPIPRLHTSAESAERLWSRLAPAMDGRGPDGRLSTLESYFDLRILEPGTTAEVAGLTVRCRPTRHPIHTIGLLVGDGRVTLGWSGDTSFVPEHVEWLSEADLIVHETNRGAAHTPIESLNGLPADVRRRMRLVHVPDDFDTTATDLVPLREGEVLEIS